MLAVAALAAFGVATATAAPITVTTTNNATTLATALAGTGVTLTGATYTGAANASGTFTGGLSAGLGFNTGIVLTTGSAAGAGTAFNPAPFNNVTPYTPPSTNNGAPGTGLIASSFDATTLSFTFTSNTVAASFSYVFASGEYPGYVGSNFNDAFRLLLNGVDLATLPGTATQVSINTVNSGSNASFFVDNSTGANTLFPYGGRTTTLSAGVTGLTPGAANTLTLVIADVADGILDSAVFVQAGSLTSAPPAAVPEPATLTLLGAGLGVLALRRRRG